MNKFESFHGIGEEIVLNMDNQPMNGIVKAIRFDDFGKVRYDIQITSVESTLKEIDSTFVYKK